MTNTMEILYHHWVGAPRPDLWPEHVAGDPVLAHGLECFEKAFWLGLLLGLEALRAEQGDRLA